MELRIEAKNKADNQKKIDDALAAQQAETNRIANEKAKTEEPAKPVQEIRTPESLRASAARIQESAQRADRGADRDAELKGASDLRAEANALEIAARIEEANALESTQPEQVKIPGKKTVTITAKFEVTVSERISVEAVVNHLKSKLSDDLKEILIDCTGY
jgi:chromatin segregation and condensation protein Rec8/ScpA/Scc1 (kleisin family)